MYSAIVKYLEYVCRDAYRCAALRLCEDRRASFWHLWFQREPYKYSTFDFNGTSASELALGGNHPDLFLGLQDRKYAKRTNVAGVNLLRSFLKHQPFSRNV